MKKAFITGITGQDGSYLAELLLHQGYEVHGLIRRSSSFNTERLNSIYRDPHDFGVNLHLHYGDLTDPIGLQNLIYNIQPDEFYNLGAQSHVKVSFEMPNYTAQVDAVSVVNILECLKNINKITKSKFYQAGTSEMFGNSPSPQSIDTKFDPRSPYAAAKVYAHAVTKNYRLGYDLFAANGILFNHESPRRGNTFVTKKIVNSAVEINQDKSKKLYLGNLQAKRDWGYAPEYVYAMWMLMQQDTPTDLVVATGITASVEEFGRYVFSLLDIGWEDSVIVEEKYFRPTEVDLLKGDVNQIEKVLGWKPKFHWKEIAEIMVESALHGEKKIDWTNFG
jgi:GDPmannose 4,6-dehydratase